MAGTGRGRPITQGERRLWAKVVERATPLSTKPVAPSAARVHGEKPGMDGAETPVRRLSAQPSQPAKASPRQVQSQGPPVKPAKVSMDHKAYGRMKRGKLEPEARIDLHGMTQSAAHSALNAFILRAQASGHRLVLVITGKGRDGAESGPVPSGPGILRRQVPHWLELPPVNQAVLQVAAAHARHGGSGAYYVYLRRR